MKEREELTTPRHPNQDTRQVKKLNKLPMLLSRDLPRGISIHSLIPHPPNIPPRNPTHNFLAQPLELVAAERLAAVVSWWPHTRHALFPLRDTGFAPPARGSYTTAWFCSTLAASAGSACRPAAGDLQAVGSAAPARACYLDGGGSAVVGGRHFFFR